MARTTGPTFILGVILSWALFHSSFGYLGWTSCHKRHDCGDHYATRRYCSSQQGNIKSGPMRTSAVRPGLLSKKLLSRQVTGKGDNQDKTESGRQEVVKTVVQSADRVDKKTSSPARDIRPSNRGDGKAKLKTKESPPIVATAASTTSSSSPSSEPLVAVSEEFRVAIKDLRKINAPKKILRLVSDHAAAGTITQNMTVHAFRTLQRMNRSDLSLEMIPIWHQAVDLAYTSAISTNNQVQEHSGSSCAAVIEMEPAAALIRSCCKLQRFDLADGIASKAGVIVRSGRSNIRDSSNSGANEPVSETQLAAFTTFLPELAVGYASVGSLEKSLSALEMMRRHSILIDIELSKQIMKGFLKQASIEEIRRCVRALLAVDGLGDNDSHQLLTSTFMRTIDFVKGAVSMETLPPGDCPEAAFIGRSNVGKSSLINIISNRKGLAFTSKTPGKTSEFNYFDAQGKTAGTKEDHRFFLVDLPGVGYAEVKKELRQSWLDLLNEYVTQRGTLRALFHLVDSRHGLLDADEECLSLLPTLPANVQYVIVLTKVDKRGGGVRRDILDRLSREISKRTDRYVPIVYTSSETREGGAEVWSILLDALAGESSDKFYSRERVTQTDAESDAESANEE